MSEQPTNAEEGTDAVGGRASECDKQVESQTVVSDDQSAQKIQPEAGAGSEVSQEISAVPVPEAPPRQFGKLGDETAFDGLLPADAPPDHLAWSKVRYWRGSQRCIFECDPETKETFQVSQFRCQGSEEAVQVVARACFVKFYDKKWTKDQVTDFKTRCLARLARQHYEPVDSDEERLHYFGQDKDDKKIAEITPPEAALEQNAASLNDEETPKIANAPSEANATKELEGAPLWPPAIEHGRNAWQAPTAYYDAQKGRWRDAKGKWTKPPEEYRETKDKKDQQEKAAKVDTLDGAEDGNETPPSKSKKKEEKCFFKDKAEHLSEDAQVETSDDAQKGIECHTKSLGEPSDEVQKGAERYKKRKAKKAHDDGRKSRRLQDTEKTSESVAVKEHGKKEKSAKKKAIRSCSSSSSNETSDGSDSGTHSRVKEDAETGTNVSTSLFAVVPSMVALGSMHRSFNAGHAASSPQLLLRVLTYEDAVRWQERCVPQHQHQHQHQHQQPQQPPSAWAAPPANMNHTVQTPACPQVQAKSVVSQRRSTIATQPRSPIATRSRPQLPFDGLPSKSAAAFDQPSKGSLAEAHLRADAKDQRARKQAKVQQKAGSEPSRDNIVDSSLVQMQQELQDFLALQRLDHGGPKVDRKERERKRKEEWEMICRVEPGSYLTGPVSEEEEQARQEEFRKQREFDELIQSENEDLEKQAKKVKARAAASFLPGPCEDPSKAHSPPSAAVCDPYEVAADASEGDEELSDRYLLGALQALDSATTKEAPADDLAVRSGEHASADEDSD